jgi:ABC-type multidrug transport system ATPase subunit
MPEFVVVDRLVKRYGARLAVRGVSFAFEDGEVIGLLGPNGSGKSTILRVLAGYLPPSAGTARIAGIDVATDSLAARRQVGYVPEDAPLYDGMRVGEFLHFMAAIKGVASRAKHSMVGAAAERLQLGPVLGMPIGKLSRGYRQRVAIAQALVNDPPLLILDEPTNALDAYQVIEVRALVRALAGRRTILVASHVLTEIERVASRVMILLDGRLRPPMRCAQPGIRRKSGCALEGPSQQSWPRCDSFRALSTPRPRGSTPHRRESHLRRPRSPKPTWSRPSRGGWRLQTSHGQSSARVSIWRSWSK